MYFLSSVKINVAHDFLLKIVGKNLPKQAVKARGVETTKIQEPHIGGGSTELSRANVTG